MCLFSISCMNVWVWEDKTSAACTHWDDRTQNHMIISKHCLGMFKGNPTEFSKLYTSIYETQKINMESRNERAVNTADFYLVLWRREKWFYQKGHGNKFLGLARYNCHWVVGKGKIDGTTIFNYIMLLY